jgi:hypothetical protein
LAKAYKVDTKGRIEVAALEDAKGLATKEGITIYLCISKGSFKREGGHLHGVP